MTTLRCNLVRGALLLAIAGCGSGSSPGTGPIPRPTSTPEKAVIEHVVIIVQENRSFDNLFPGFPGADAPKYGLNGTTRVVLQPVRLESPQILENNWRDSILAWDNGKMDGFEREYLEPSGGHSLLAYSFVPLAETVPYWTMAKQYALADHMFPTEFGPSFTAHLTLIGGNTDVGPGPVAEVDFPSALPWGCDAPPSTTTATLDQHRVESPNGPFPCFTQFRTLADTLDAAKVSWRYYAPAVNSGLDGDAWSEFSAIEKVRHGPDWAKVISPETRVLTDIAHGKLPRVAWVIPDLANSDHPATGSNTGPSWVASVVNAIGTSPYWGSTAIFVVWDDWGGWYDDIAPQQLDARGLGIRVPCIVISPYAKHGFVSHTQYEFGSILKFVDETFGLPPLGPESAGYTDTRATSIADSFNFTQAPRPFTPLPQDVPASHFLNEKPSLKPPDNH
jgi:phospholipase C